MSFANYRFYSRHALEYLDLPRPGRLFVFIHIDDLIIHIPKVFLAPPLTAERAAANPNENPNSKFASLIRVLKPYDKSADYTVVSTLRVAPPPASPSEAISHRWRCPHLAL
jgi:hypothetical protein